MIRTPSFRRLNNIVFSKQYYCVLFSTNYISIYKRFGASRVSPAVDI